MTKIYSTYEEVSAFKGEKAVLLFSGGLDSMYAAICLREMDLEVHAFLADVGQTIQEEHFDVLRELGIRLKKVDLKPILCDDYLSKGILSNALYNDHFPISSSYTRPAIAVEALKYAEEIDSRLIVHSATPYQNSATRFNFSILSLAPEVDIFCPAIGEFKTREEKVELLEGKGISYSKESPVYSIDENLWARVIENDTLEYPSIDLPSSGIFNWTVDPDKCQVEPTLVSLKFEEGLPVQLNDEKLSLLEVIERLNQLLGPYGIGRYTGLEDGLFGVKNPEIREAPAAELLHRSHKMLEEMVLSTEELDLKKQLDRKWTEHVTLGRWFGSLKKHIDEAEKSFNKSVTGTLRWKVYPGQLLCVAKQSEFSRHATQFESFVNEFHPFSLDSFYQQLVREHGGQALPLKTAIRK